MVSHHMKKISRTCAHSLTPASLQPAGSRIERRTGLLGPGLQPASLVAGTRHRCIKVTTVGGEAGRAGNVGCARLGRVGHTGAEGRLLVLPLSRRDRVAGLVVLLLTGGDVRAATEVVGGRDVVSSRGGAEDVVLLTTGGVVLRVVVVSTSTGQASGAGSGTDWCGGVVAAVGGMGSGSGQRGTGRLGA